MNIRVLDKIESGYVKMNWVDHIHKVPVKDLDKVLDIIDNFKSNKSAKEIIIFKFKKIKGYVTVNRSEYNQILKYIYDKFIEYEMYENCKKSLLIINKLNKSK
jgi:hypothetical protein